MYDLFCERWHEAAPPRLPKVPIMAPPCLSSASLAALTRRHGANAMVVYSTAVIVLLSLLVTSICLLLFQGYIDRLGIAICIVAPLLIFPWPARLFLVTFLQLQRIEEELRHRNRELEKALAEVKTLSGLLPLCCSCKKVRDDRGYWQELEKYFADHLDLRMSHGFCPDCLSRLYPEVAGELTASALGDRRGLRSPHPEGTGTEKGI